MTSLPEIIVPGKSGKSASQKIFESAFIEESNSPKTLPIATTGSYIPIPKQAPDHSHESHRTLSKDMPLLPPNSLHENQNKIPSLNFDAKSEWFVVLSPREEKGVAGPKSINELRIMYKYGEIKDSTLIWREGEQNWDRLINVNHVRFRIIQLPQVPAKSVSNGSEMKLLSENMATFKKFVDQPLSRVCSVCGNLAAGHTVGIGEQAPHYTSGPVGSSTVASEVIPGFLWVGNAASSKQNPINELAITLAINCTPNLQGALPHPPFFRTKVAALDENPKENVPSTSKLEEILFMFTSVFDYIENERCGFTSRSDVKKEYRGPTDKFGRPLQKDNSAVYPAARGTFEGKTPPVRVLLWSRLGFDRACAMAASYFVKRWGLTVNRALDIVQSCRPGMKISRSYIYALQEWGKLHTLGTLYCMDCVMVVEVDAENETRDIVEGTKITKIDSMLLAIQDKPSLVKKECLQDPAVFLPQVFSRLDYTVEDMSTAQSNTTKLTNSILTENQFQHIYDLNLLGLHLGDKGMEDLFSIFFDVQLLHSLRHLNLGDNDITCVGISHVVDYIVPPAKNLLPYLDVFLDLTILGLSNNRIGEMGARKIAHLLNNAHSLTSLNISNNPLQDEGVAVILDTLGLPPFIDDPEPDADGNVPVVECHFNNSLTALNLSGTGMGEIAMESLIEVFRNNETLVSLTLDNNLGIPKSMIKPLANVIRVNSHCMERLSFADSEQTVKSFGYLAKMLEGYTPWKHWCFARSGLAGLHIGALAKYMPSTRTLMFLDLSNNDIGDMGAEYLAMALQVEYVISEASEKDQEDASADAEAAQTAAGSRSTVLDYDGKPLPSTSEQSKVSAQPKAKFAPIKHLDVNCCGFGPRGCKVVLTACSNHPSLTYLDMSDNNLGPDIEDISAALSQCRFKELKLNRCKLQTKGAKTILELLTSTNEGTLGHRLAGLSLSGNGISDSVAHQLAGFLEHNMIIQAVDLGFNDISNTHEKTLRAPILLPSTASITKQIVPLHVNLIGNPCPDYMLETPGFSRSKQSLRFGIRKDESNHRNPDGSLKVPMDNISLCAREHYLERVDYFKKYAADMGQVDINNIS